MSSPHGSGVFMRRDIFALFAIWLAVGAVMTWLNWPSIDDRRFRDPDDAMRLLQVRDWLGGQSWFDVTQYRLNDPAGVPMHWSRLVDVPIAGTILLARPFLGREGAETAALIFVPLLTLGICMALVHAIASRLLTRRAALVAALAVPVSLGGLTQMCVTRIDHHGWQIVLALVTVLAAMGERQRRSGAIAGVAMALWLNISIEGLPFAAAVGALFALRWLADRSAANRLRAYLAALAGASLLVFGLTHAPSTWLAQPRDVVGSAHLAAFVVAALVAALAVRPNVDLPGSRLAVLVGVGVATLAAMFAVDPRWLSGPFGMLDPLVRALWYPTVDEGLAVWQVPWSEAATSLAQPLVGLAGAWLGLRRSVNAQREPWATYFVLLGAVTIAGVFVLRAETAASVISLPGTALLCQLAYRRARKLSLMLPRAIATTAALGVMTPAYAVPLSIARTDQRAQTAFAGFQNCIKRSEVMKLRALPAGEIAAPLDITPTILLHTAHRAIGSGHHRNITGMRDVIRLFILPPAGGVPIIATRHVDYVVLCPGAHELTRYARWSGGLSAMLRDGTPPQWLEPIHVPGVRALRVWRVRRDLLPADSHA
jgi:hypothetical protein